MSRTVFLLIGQHTSCAKGSVFPVTLDHFHFLWVNSNSSCVQPDRGALALGKKREGMAFLWETEPFRREVRRMYAVASYQGKNISPAFIHLLCTAVHGVSLISVYRNGLGGVWGAVGWGSGECVCGLFPAIRSP